MEAASNAQSELQRIEQQIEQLQGAAGNNQEALKQLESLQQRVESLRRQISGQLTPVGTHRISPSPDAALPSGLHRTHLSRLQ